MADIGFGMSAKDKENLFTLFYRGGGDEKKKVEGYGIGMTLAHKIIHLHDGNIAVHSEQGKGTLFIVEIPHIWHNPHNIHLPINKRLTDSLIVF